MRKIHINIAVLEPSEIIYEGLSNVFLKSGQYFNLFKAESVNELENLLNYEKLDVAIINPSQIQNKDKEFGALRKINPGLVCIALVYTFFDQQILARFDNIIHITDVPSNIIELINKSGETNSAHATNPEQEQLSEREIEVLKHIVAGMSNKEIAEKLFISIHTVVSHRKNISQKTGIKSQAGLTIYAISNKIIQIEDYTN